ncbi:hypothetical protein DAPPUDRAFT_307784 [Daphnia pulex]|uniref:Peroxinectin n=1 Tax=Daphnia pulex TaxID=6669 RepID=E9G110_DAPPU|nr:hypothetical protein DAPPUDRAFT_307784 [Daphnia pulex]|eukprot:EFX86585.1 hypothetical protein DAPPUDRAFT_307784 [Daphnia pulex]
MAMLRGFVGVFVASFLFAVANSEAYGTYTLAYKPVEKVYYCPKVGGLESRCRPIRDCAVWHDLVESTPGTACQLSDGYPGACCPDLPYNYNGKALKEPVTCDPNVELESHVQCLDVFSINAAAAAGNFQLRLNVENENRISSNGIEVSPGSSRATHQRFFGSSEETRGINKEAQVGLETAVHIIQRFKIDSKQVPCALSRFKYEDTDLADKCATLDVKCNETQLNSPFRTLDGSCNNVENLIWGRSNSQYMRMLNSEFNDGVQEPRKAKNGEKLPSPRLVSISVVHDLDRPSETGTVWLMQYGQLLDHDMVQSQERTLENGNPIACCADDGRHLSAENLNSHCFPIDIGEEDPFYSKFNKTCLSFVRSKLACRNDRRFGAVEQMNANTHFLDLSLVYGSDAATAAELRANSSGKLNVTSRGGDLDLLPPSGDSSPLSAPCTLPKEVSGIDPPADVKCFKAGDIRPDVTPTMAVTQTIFLREHNRLAEELAKLNPHWDDERLYQEARRILISQAQHITYNEWLPIIIGREKMQELGLLPLQNGFSSDYDKTLNPGILNAFVGAAFRFGHSMVQGKPQLVNHQRVKEREILLRHHFFKPQEVYTPGNLDKFLIGLATQPSQKVDAYFTEELTNHLFEETGKGFGLDLVALNIQRGRDHGLKTYNSYRELCGYKRAKDFDDLTDLFHPDLIERFKKLYSSVDDIDLFIAGVNEAKPRNSYVGPTFQCIIANQFLNLKRGDRYFYDLQGQPGSFSKEQLFEIRKTSMARLVCDNSKVYTLQPNVFKIVCDVNPLVSCDSYSIPRLDLRPWQENSKKISYEKRY